MAKRIRDSLTGGTGDVNPQWLRISAAQSGTDATTTVQQQLPIQRLPTGNRSQIIEIIKVFWYIPQVGGTAAGEVAYSITANLATSSSGTTAYLASNPKVIDFVSRFKNEAFTAAGTYYTVSDNPVVHDLTDGSGHGVLVATDSMYVQVISASTGNTNTIVCAILYRFKDIGLQEYIGIVQSQQ
jgi:hypothetical protein